MSAVTTLSVAVACQLISSGNYSADSFALANLAASPTMVIPNDYTRFPDIGVAYKYFNYKRPWNQARKLCIEEGGNLVILDTFKKIEYVMRVKPSDGETHVGLHRAFDLNEWTSVKTGLPVAVQSWAPITNFGQENLLCSALWYDGRGITADPCDRLRNFVCEIPLPAN